MLENRIRKNGNYFCWSFPGAFLFITIQAQVASREGNCREQAGKQAPKPTPEA